MSVCIYTNKQKEFPAFTSRDVEDFADAFKVIEAESSLDAFSENAGRAAGASGDPTAPAEVENQFQKES